MSKPTEEKKLSIEEKIAQGYFGNGKNILLIMADEFRYPIHKDGGGMKKDFKNVLGFQNVDSNESEEECIDPKVRELFPGFMKLRDNAVVLTNHTVATTACVPSRAAMFTGQYGTKNGVTQTDGVFKGASEDGFNWLDPNGLPTLGDWFKQNNYSTHYFGKCHFAHPKKQSLKNWGFDDWETSFPEPHGTLKNNLGMYRDNGFTDLVTTFLRRKGMALDYDQEVGRIELNENLNERQKERAIEKIKKKPWFAVASFTNPHDITTWPVLPSQAEGKLTDYIDSKINNDLIKGKKEQVKEAISKLRDAKPLGIPRKNQRSAPPEQGTWTFNMNPGGITKHCAELPTTWNEDLKDKPDCQFDYSLKLGIALAAKTGEEVIANNSAKLTGMPLALANDSEEWTEAYIQYYTYLHHLLDQQINSVLETLEESGLREDTIVVFVPDHGEYGGSHGKMMQKWHTAYQEAIHVPVVISMPKSEEDSGKNMAPKPITELTSHIDILPTLLGLIDVTPEEVNKLKKDLGGFDVPNFVGADLSDLITGKAAKIKDPFGLNPKGRDSILFTTSDMITEPIDSDKKNKDYEIYLSAVENYIQKGERTLFNGQFDEAKRMHSGSVVQPAEVHCIREGDFKLVRYRDYHDPYNQNKYQWEMYNLENDPNEMRNLLKYKTHEINEPRFVCNPLLPNTGTPDFDPIKIVSKANDLYVKLLELIERML
ncbi:sulfatase-like hydrolase/transferase [Tenacibaculum sp.]|nr:sulfatase-like hydrolase/transferase [Tenacibaculum sp.]